MESKRHKIKRRVKKPKTLVNTVKKRLKSDYRKSKIIVLVILTVIASVIGYFALSMPLPKAPNNEDSYANDEKRIKDAIYDHRNGQH